jgi:hypothetical protein
MSYLLAQSNYNYKYDRRLVRNLRQKPKSDKLLGALANPGEGVVGRVRPLARLLRRAPAVEAGGAMSRRAYTCIFPPSAAPPDCQGALQEERLALGLDRCLMIQRSWPQHPSKPTRRSATAATATGHKPTPRARCLLSNQAWKSLHPRDRRRVPFAGQRIRLRSV